MKHLLFFIGAFTLFIGCNSFPSPASIDAFGENFFNAVKNNDLNSFRYFYLTVDEYKQALVNGSTDLNKEDFDDEIKFYKQIRSKPDFASYYLDDFRSQKEFKEIIWSETKFESANYVNFENSYFKDAYKLNITFLFNGDRYRFEDLIVFKVKLTLQGKLVDRFVTQ